jgi:7,8-dihydropterin-6-yl-methyl-4-(beta-D-ribofuranosyl)aminobenzene 5'-phosphate synthase
MCCCGVRAAAGAGENPKRTKPIVITILYDNTSIADSILPDHGFACLIEAGGHTCLFDAGRKPEILLTNVKRMGVDCSRIERVFVSHLHNDHTGGLFDILAKCSKPALCMPVSYPRQKGESFGDQTDKEYAALLDCLRPFVSALTQYRQPAHWGDSFYTTGVIDTLSYEQAMILPTPKGLIVITGCAHPGIVEIVKQAKKAMNQDVYFVLGGFHLLPTDSTEVRAIARELRPLTKYIGPCHCTGETAERIFKDIFKEDYIEVHAGSKLKIDEYP